MNIEIEPYAYSKLGDHVKVTMSNIEPMCNTCAHWYNNLFCEIMWEPNKDGTCYLHANWSILDYGDKND